MKNESHKGLDSLFLLPEMSVDAYEENRIREVLRGHFTILLLRLESDSQMMPLLAESNLRTFALAQIDSLTSFFNELSLKIRPASEFYHSCIITDEEVDAIAQHIHNQWIENVQNHDDSDESLYLCPFEMLPYNRKRFYREIFYCIPVALKMVGYEVVKPNETEFLRSEITESIARALHERFRHLIRSVNDEVINSVNLSYLHDVKYQETEFDSLPPAIKNANFDSAYHIPTKLLAIGYTLDYQDNGAETALLSLDEGDIETMAKLEHERWCWEKRLSGFIYGEVKTLSTHHCLKPYDELSEFEKSKDRDQVVSYPLIIRDLNYKVVPVSQEHIGKITYTYRKPSEIEKDMLILEQQVNAISDLLNTTEKSNIDLSISTLDAINNRLNHALAGFNDVRDSIRRSEHIQRSILASKLFFRTCFPDSFLLFKPLDIVSGDFYFVSQIDDIKIIAVADCTGHGISAGMLSMVCCNYLDNAVNVQGLTDPGAILKMLFPVLEEFLYRQTGQSGSGEGMDISICSLQPDSQILRYAGVNRPLLLFRRELEVVTPLRCIGNKQTMVLSDSFRTNEFQLAKGDRFYLFSDGITDQFGGDMSAPQRFKQKRLADLLSEIHDYPMQRQCELLNETIEKWRASANETQTDDIIVVGVTV